MITWDQLEWGARASTSFAWVGADIPGVPDGHVWRRVRSPFKVEFWWCHEANKRRANRDVYDPVEAACFLIQLQEQFK